MTPKPCENPRACTTLNNEAGDEAWDNPDALVHYLAKYDEFGIPIHDGMKMSYAILSFCPWCGARLPVSKREAWFDELEAQGIDPSQDDIPEKFQTDQWWREREGGSPA